MSRTIQLDSKISSKLNSKLKLPAVAINLTELRSLQGEKLAVRLLEWFELGTLLVTLGGIFLNLFALPKLDIWVAGLLIALAVRIVRGLVFKQVIFPATNIDLLVLTNVTLFLISLVLQTNETTLLTLGGSNIWSVGSILLRGLTIYLLFVNLSRKLTRTLVFWFIVLGVLLMQLQANALGQLSLLTIASNSQIFLLQWPMLGTIFLVGLFVAHKGIFRRLVIGLLLIWQLVLLVNTFYQPNLLFLGITLILLGLFLVVIQRQNLLKDLREPKKAYGWLILFSGIIVIIATVVLSFTNPQFSRYLEVLANSFGQIPQRLNGVMEWVAGAGLTSSGTSTQSVFLSYGVLGLVGEALLFGVLFIHVRKLFKNNWSILTAEGVKVIALLIGFLFMIMNSLLGVIDLSGLLMTMLLGTFLLSLGNVKAAVKETKERISKKLAAKQSSILAGILPDAVRQELSIGLRVVLVISVIVYTPVVIRFFQDLL